MGERTVVALYLRVSTIEQAIKGYSLGAQDYTLSGYCDINDYEIYKIYSDKGISGKDLKHRPGMLEMLADAEKGLFKKIIVWKLSRFSRNLKDLVIVCDHLDKIGVSLESSSEGFNSVTPAGRMARAMLAAVSQYQREIIGENVSFGLAERARQGRRTCHEILGFNPLDKDSFTINKKEAEYVIFCYEKYLIEESISEVTRLAKQKGYRGKRGREPSTSSVYTILTRPEYAGYNILNGRLYKGMYDPIIPPQMFNEVQDLIEKNGKGTRKRKLYRVPA